MKTILRQTCWKHLWHMHIRPNWVDSLAKRQAGRSSRVHLSLNWTHYWQASAVSLMPPGDQGWLIPRGSTSWHFGLPRRYSGSVNRAAQPLPRAPLRTHSNRSRNALVNHRSRPGIEATSSWTQRKGWTNFARRSLPPGGPANPNLGPSDSTG